MLSQMDNSDWGKRIKIENEKSDPLYNKISLIERYVKSKVGGDISFYDDKPLQAIHLRWENPNLIPKDALNFDYKIQYIDLISIEDPELYGKAIVERILAFLEEK